MEQYIPKSTLVEKIKRLMNRYDSEYDEDSTEFKAAKGNVCHEILCIIDTLEVKEVDLQKEIDRVWDNTSDNFSEDGWKEFEDIAKHFFELGLKAQ